jgi:hypothetical protein
MTQVRHPFVADVQAPHASLLRLIACRRQPHLNLLHARRRNWRIDYGLFMPSTEFLSMSEYYVLVLFLLHSLSEFSSSDWRNRLLAIAYIDQMLITILFLLLRVRNEVSRGLQNRHRCSNFFLKKEVRVLPFIKKEIEIQPKLQTSKPGQAWRKHRTHPAEAGARLAPNLKRHTKRRNRT